MAGRNDNLFNFGFVLIKFEHTVVKLDNIKRKIGFLEVLKLVVG